MSLLWLISEAHASDISTYQTPLRILTLNGSKCAELSKNVPSGG